jgi:hypothetical protein
LHTAPDPTGGPGADPDRDRTTGRFLPGNRASLLIGAKSARFWNAASEARRELRESVIADAGHSLDDAPKALQIASDGLAQATLVRDSAFARLVESGGPFTVHGRARQVFTAWLSACERVDRSLRLLGLKRTPKEQDVHDWLYGDDGDDPNTDPSTDGGSNGDESTDSDSSGDPSTSDRRDDE